VRGNMHSSNALLLKIALLQAPDTDLQLLQGVTLRLCSISNEYREINDVAATPWQSMQHISGRQLRLEIEWIVTPEPAANRLRKAALQGIALRCQITFSGSGTAEGEFFIPAYEERGEDADVLRYRATLQSRGVLTQTFA
jgi:hypothetical protein